MKELGWWVVSGSLTDEGKEGKGEERMIDCVHEAGAEAEANTTEKISLALIEITEEE